MRILKDVEMKEYSHMKVGGTAKELIFIEDRNEFKEVLSTRDRVYFLGNGTNTLIDDGYLDISFISLKNFQNITVEEKTDEYDLVRVEAGLDLDDLIDYMEKNDYTGLENITGIPGSVGGLVNILFKFKRGFDKECAEDKRNQRETKHPLDYPNLGSTFKNPEGTFAAQLISDAGLKEYRVGDAQVAFKHPNFIINLGNAKFSDVMEVIAHVKKVVSEKFNINLETEIIILKNN